MTALSYLYVIVGIAFFVFAALVTRIATEPGDVRPPVSELQGQANHASGAASTPPAPSRTQPTRQVATVAHRRERH